ncbi:MAG TPA: PaaI family thioesterase [Streptosporangiaceae bacterium]|nr:PaaI family thioesterase [Streptosporangiaceae bacterium]
MTDKPDGIQPGERFAGIGHLDGARTEGPHIWRTLGYRRIAWQPGGTTLEWDAPLEYCFPASGGPVVQGGMVTALLDAAMGGACWTVLNEDEVFLTADLRVEFLRASRPGTLRASGEVVRRGRRAVFCAAELFDEAGSLLAAGRCTQVVLPSRGQAGRYDAHPDDGGPPLDARG